LDRYDGLGGLDRCDRLAKAFLPLAAECFSPWGWR
jgi:hypothetical protein